jgi:hypothetical protein
VGGFGRTLRSLDIERGDQALAGQHNICLCSAFRTEGEGIGPGPVMRRFSQGANAQSLHSSHHVKKAYSKVLTSAPAGANDWVPTIDASI